MVSFIVHYHCTSEAHQFYLASFPGPTSQTIGKAGGGPGTFWHVTDVKLRRHRRGFPLAKRCTNARLRDRAKKSERRRVLARGRYKVQDDPIGPCTNKRCIQCTNKRCIQWCT